MLVKVATPATAALESVPWRAPLPTWRFTVTVEVSVVTRSEERRVGKASGWVGRLEPDVETGGCVVTTSLLAAAGVTVKAVASARVGAPLVKRSVFAAET